MSQKNYGIEKLQTHQNFIAVINTDTPRKNVTIESRKKNKGKTRTDITRRDPII